MKKILVLGAGLVSKPLVHYLTGQAGISVDVASRTVSKAEALVAGRPRSSAIALDAKDEAALEKLVKKHDLAISLLPATEHIRVAKLCLKYKKHMATTSYMSKEMKALDGDVKKAGLTFINECGVDPGIDHMSAMRIIDDAKSNGGKVVSFRSYCGGIPAPEANTNPIGYKFSWAPRGVLVAATAPAKYLENQKTVEMPGDELFAKPEIVKIKGVGNLEGYPNRDSLPYMEMYGLEGVKTMFRGTLRNPGHCETWYRWVKLGLFDQTRRSDLEGMTYRRFMQGFVGGDDDPKKALARKLGLPDNAPPIAKLDWLGMFENEPIPRIDGGNVDVMAARMYEKCRYREGERDMLVMRHEFKIDYADRAEKVFSTLVDFGIPGGDSSMARTVSLPVAIAARMIIEGSIAERGVIAPVRPAVYNPILDELSEMGISMEESKEPAPL